MNSKSYRIAMLRMLGGKPIVGSLASGCREQPGLRVSEFLLDLAIRNSKGEISDEEVSRLIKEHYPNSPLRDTLSHHPLDGGYEVIPSDSPKIKEIEEYNRKLRPELYKSHNNNT